MLLKYSLSALKNVKDPVWLAMAEEMWLFLSQKWLTLSTNLQFCLLFSHLCFHFNVTCEDYDVVFVVFSLFCVAKKSEKY
jgi:hypothetical protein